MGYTNVKNYADGYFKWKEAGLPVTVSDKAPMSALYSLPIKVAEGVYSAIGATQPTTYENGNHNCTSSGECEAPKCFNSITVSPMVMLNPSSNI